MLHLHYIERLNSEVIACCGSMLEESWNFLEGSVTECVFTFLVKIVLFLREIRILTNQIIQTCCQDRTGQWNGLCSELYFFFPLLTQLTFIRPHVGCIPVQNSVNSLFQSIAFSHILAPLIGNNSLVEWWIRLCGVKASRRSQTLDYYTRWRAVLSYITGPWFGIFMSLQWWFRHFHIGRKCNVNPAIGSVFVYYSLAYQAFCHY